VTSVDIGDRSRPEAVNVILHQHEAITDVLTGSEKLSRRVAGCYGVRIISRYVIG
jgi:hypothetical protein